MQASPTRPTFSKNIFLINKYFPLFLGTCADDSCNQDATQQEEGHNCVCLNGSRGRHCEKRKASKCGVKSSPGRCGQLPIKSISVTVP